MPGPRSTPPDPTGVHASAADARSRQLGLGLVAADGVSDRTQWPAMFREFTDRNSGRLATLEVEDRELRAQLEARGYPLLGVEYDSRAGSVEIMLGDFAPGGRHLTHATRAATSVAVLQAADGRDRALLVARGAWQARLVLSESGARPEP